MMKIKEQKEQKRREFTERESKQAQVSAAAAVAEMLPGAVPDGFECPISQELMVDPVMTVADGHSYERSYIEQWLRTRKKSPLTSMPLSTALIVPNHNLRKAIQHCLLLPNP